MSRIVVGLALAATLLSALAAGCATEGEKTAVSPKTVTVTTTETVKATPPPFSAPEQLFPPYEPPAEERYRNGKRLAARVAQNLATFAPGAAAVDLARSVGLDATGGLEPLLDPSRRSAGEVVYVQLSGTTATTLGTMVVVSQHLENGDGEEETVVRVMDIRLRRTDGAWSLDRVASVGGSPVQRPEQISAAAARVLDHPAIELPDTVRWDIHRGKVNDALLRALADAADRWPIALTVLSTGHPPRVWATPRTSAHTVGFAADIYAVGGELVVRQRQRGSKAYRLVEAFLAGGAAQVGSPWVLPPGGRRSFTDVVHEDHLHVQQSSATARDSLTLGG